MLISVRGQELFCEIYVDQGFIKLWRKSIDSSVFQDANLWKLWTWCLMRANHKDVFVPVKTGRGQTVIELKRGQFIFGRRTAAKVLKMKSSTIGYRMQVLEKLQNLDRQVNHHFTIVTIRNYDKYNDIKNNFDRQVNHQLSTNCPPTDTDKNYKNYKNVKKDLKPSYSELEKSSDSEPNEIPLFKILLIKKDGEFLIFQKDVDQWQETFPGVDVLQQLREIKLWNFNNPTKRKTRNGIRRHISSWMSREQDRGRGKTGNSEEDILRRLRKKEKELNDEA